MIRVFALAVFLGLHVLSEAQFHNLSLPQQSQKSAISQQIGATWIHIAYGSPSVQGRDVWNDAGVIPQNGTPIAWRAGANENTVIAFDTDVFIEGKPLSAGSYGFHIVPNGHSHSLLFTAKDNLWGSYYLDIENDVDFRVEVSDTAHSFTEHLTYQFIHRTDSSTVISLNWGDRSIPFHVSVDLNKTVIEKLRYDLNGENTYRWQAWNDAAGWCEQRSTNLEEALSWVNRSINGGYGGFGGNKNLTNLATKVRILRALNRTDEMVETIEEATQMRYSINEARSFGQMLIEIEEDEHAINFLKKGLETYENEWGMQFIIAKAYYFNDNLKKAVYYLNQCREHSSERFHPRVDTTMEEMKAKRFVSNNRT